MSIDVAKEREIKAALIDWLYSKGMVQNAVLINEMVVANWSRRADVVVANGHLYAYEIKSEFDSLKRLDGQVRSFSEHFDKVVVVAASKFVSAILTEYPSEIGVLEVFAGKDGLEFKQVRPGRIDAIKSIRHLSSHISKADIVRLLKAHDIDVDPAERRVALEALLERVPVSRAREFVLRCIKNKYRGTFEAFDAARLVDGTYSSIPELSRRNQLLRMYSQHEPSQAMVDLAKKSNARDIDLVALEMKYGALPEEMPRVVLTRKSSARRRDPRLPHQSQ